MVHRLDDGFPHLQRLELCGRESTDVAIAKAKWFSGSLVTVELHSSLSFSLKRSRSFAPLPFLAWMMRLSSSILAILLWAFAASLLPVALGYSIIVVITSSVGLSFLWVPACVLCVLAFCRKMAG